MIDRFDRQRRIRGWNQDRFRNCRVLVCGRDWLGTFTTWGLASLGVGEILWVGHPERATDPMARWFLAQPCPFTGSAIYDYPFDIEYGPEIEWIDGGRKLDALIACSEDAAADRACARFATTRGAFFRAASTAAGGWVGGRPATSVDTSAEHPIVAMVAAALIVDSFREAIAPLNRGELPEGPLSLDPPASDPDGTCLLVGVGGIGVYAAVIAAALGLSLNLIDFDRVDTSNLNRQGLFDSTDAERAAYKATAARDALARFFPSALVRFGVGRVDATMAATLVRGPRVVLCAVDNAATRLVLQDAAGAGGVPIVQGGTDVFAADCFTQEPGGPTIDDQMHGALSEASRREARALQDHGGGCGGNPSYVVPGMMAGALMMYRAVQSGGWRRGLSPIHWRSGSVPIEERSRTDGFEIGELAL